MGKNRRNSLTGKGKSTGATGKPADAEIPSAFFLNPVFQLAIVLIVGCAVYANTFTVPFVLDDVTSITGNPAVTSFNLTFKSRVLGDLTFALDYFFHGSDLAGYHLVNLLIHLVNGCLVFFLTRLILRTLLVRAEGEDNNLGLAPLFVALLFTCHPLQTQAVTYVSQRFASLATLFYLLTHLLWLQAKAVSMSRNRWMLIAAAFLSALAAMATKEIAFTLPATIFLVEVIFFPGSWRRKMIPFLGFAMASLLVPLTLLASAGKSAGIAQKIHMLITPTTVIPRSDYLVTQFAVIATYLRLLILPVGQNLDHDFPIYHSLLSVPVAVGLTAILLLVFTAGYLVRRSLTSGRPELRLIAFGIFWFFITLAVESSLIPLQDVIFEHRVYLPSFGFFLSACTALLAPSRKNSPWVPFFLTLIVLVLAAAAAGRNHVWRDEASLWEDVTRKSPAKARAHGSLGLAYQNRGDVAAAEKEYRAAIQLAPKEPAGYNNLGTLLFFQKKLPEAAKAYREALRLDPTIVKAHYNLGLVLTEQGELAGGVEELRQAIRLKPDYDQAYNNVGIAYAKLRRYDEALEAFNTARKLNPGNREAATNHESLTKALKSH